jgi:hypothetical protein
VIEQVGAAERMGRTIRLGAQVIGGLDPNATVNAWGGPSYLGALLAHWLDGIVGFYVAAFLLSRLLLRPEGELR